MIAQHFHYEILETKPLTFLEEFKDHRRLQVFHEKGCKCVKCGVEGTRLALGKANNGSLHWDVYTDDFYPLTVDHIIPKSKGGPDHIDNYQPMCYLCNTKKGNGDWSSWSRPKYPSEKIQRPSSQFQKGGVEVGDVVYRRVNKNRFESLGVVSQFCSNPHHPHENLSIQIEGNTKSYYLSTHVYKQKQ
jgi:5-methylcytosine-specific restriction endonuclease McrA